MHRKNTKIMLAAVSVITLTICSCANQKKAQTPNTREPTESGLESPIGMSEATAHSTQVDWVDPLNETKDQRNARMAWWREARFGLFIHWGVYAVPAGTYEGEQIKGIGEWIMLKAKIPVEKYRAYAKEFNPVQYDPKAWVKMAKDAGMKYIVITAKHHDGFSLFDSKVTDWDIADASPYGKDLLRPLVGEAKKQGLKMGFYYSQAQDWTHQGGGKRGLEEGEYWDKAHAGSFDTYLNEIAYPQVKEILTDYDIDILWWDTPQWMTEERGKLLRPLLALRPGLITNNRLGGGFKGDTDTPEQHVPATGIEGRDWEVCMTMNHTWGYKTHDDDWKSTEYLIHALVDIVSKGGNFLLNVGPKSDGTIPKASIERLAGIGRWMKHNSESIYGTSASPFRRPKWGRCTRKDLENDVTRLYLQVFDWPKGKSLFVPVNNDVIACHSLTDPKKKFETSKQEGGLTVQLTGESENDISSVVVLDIKGTPDVPNQNIAVDPKGVLRLTVEDGDLENRGYVATRHARLVQDKKNSYVTWKETQSWMEWPIEIDSDTEFHVYVRAATQSGKNRIQLEVGDEKKEFRLPNTGGLASFKKVKVGTVKIPRGSATLLIKGNKEKWKECRLSHLEFRPAK